MKFSRNCPDCKKELTYSNIYNLNYANKKNSFCMSCWQKGNKNPMFGKHYKHTEEAKLKMSLKLKGKKRTPEQRKRISEALKRPEVKEKMFNSMKYFYESRKGCTPWNKGKKCPNQGAKGKNHWNYKGGCWNKGKKDVYSDETLKKMRIAKINYMKSLSVIYPVYNKNSCKIFKNINEKYELNGIYAENSGEYYLEELGYWLDFYDKEKNFVIEYYERGHYNADEELNEKTKKREKEIIEKLDCIFYRINAFNEKQLKLEPIKIKENNIEIKLDNIEVAK